VNVFRQRGSVSAVFRKLRFGGPTFEEMHLPGGLLPCHEILVNTGRIAERIADPDKTAQIHDVIAEGGYYGMQTFDQSLLQLVKEGGVSLDAALAASTNPHDFQLLLQQAGMSPA